MALTKQKKNQEKGICYYTLTANISPEIMCTCRAVAPRTGKIIKNPQWFWKRRDFAICITFCIYVKSISRSHYFHICYRHALEFSKVVD